MSIVWIECEKCDSPVAPARDWNPADDPICNTCDKYVEGD